VYSFDFHATTKTRECRVGDCVQGVDFFEWITRLQLQFSFADRSIVGIVRLLPSLIRTRGILCILLLWNFLYFLKIYVHNILLRPKPSKRRKRKIAFFSPRRDRCFGRRGKCEDQLHRERTKNSALGPAAAAKRELFLPKKTRFARRMNRYIVGGQRRTNWSLARCT